MTRIQGVVTRIIRTRGFGFLKGDDGQSYFLHIDNLKTGSVWEQINEGKRLEFVPDSNGTKGNGLRALEVTLCP